MTKPRIAKGVGFPKAARKSLVLFDDDDRYNLSNCSGVNDTVVAVLLDSAILGAGFKTLGIRGK